MGIQASTARRADSLRCSGVIAAALAGPPLRGQEIVGQEIVGARDCGARNSGARNSEEIVSGTIPRTPAIPHGVFQTELRNGLRHPFLRTIRSAFFYRVADVFNFFLPLRLVHPFQVTARFRQGPAIRQWFLTPLCSHYNRCRTWDL